MRWYSYGPNRTLCNVLEEMRKMHETRNYSALLSLIEEAQIMGNRMEAGLHDVKDIRAMQEEKSELRRELKKLHDELNSLKKESKD